VRRLINFSAGPSLLPEGVLAGAADELVEYRDRGMSLLEMSHRGGDYEDVHDATVDAVRRVFSVPIEFSILLLQGGATLQFTMVPMNLVPEGQSGGYVVSGAWGAKAFDDAGKHATAYAAWTGAAEGFRKMPATAEIKVLPRTRYVHITSNETINGTQMSDWPRQLESPLVADMSSDIMSRPLPWELFDLVYAGAQKNLGPSGVTLVIVRDEAVDRANADLGSYLSYAKHRGANSLLNTPPVFGVWLMGMTVEWIEAGGGVEAMEKRAAARADLLYGAIDGSFYTSPVDPSSRSAMNVVFRLPTEELEQRFLDGAADEGLVNLKGHRSVGGIRASLYNAMPTEGVERLVSFMDGFRARS
jgi:phosphoserine aminotransferase